MSSLLIALILSAGPADAPAAKTERGYHEISKDMRELLKRESQAKSSAERAAALCDLCDLYAELAVDSRLTVSDTLKEYKGTIRNRLLKSKNELKAKLAREKRSAPKNAKPADAIALVPAQAQAVSQSLGEQLALASSSLGGPAKIFADAAASQPAGARGGSTKADGDELIALIEKTIAPDTWEVNGGPGSIVYYPGLMALVVRATSEVHDETGALLENLRDAGR